MTAERPGAICEIGPAAVAARKRRSRTSAALSRICVTLHPTRRLRDRSAGSIAAPGRIVSVIHPHFRRLPLFGIDAIWSVSIII
jgi:glycogen debranching enzyme